MLAARSRSYALAWRACVAAWRRSFPWSRSMDYRRVNDRLTMTSDDPCDWREARKSVCEPTRSAGCGIRYRPRTMWKRLSGRATVRLSTGWGLLVTKTVLITWCRRQQHPGGKAGGQHFSHAGVEPCGCSTLTSARRPCNSRRRTWRNGTDAWVTQFAAGVDAVIHLAENPSPRTSWASAQRLNIDMTAKRL